MDCNCFDNWTFDQVPWYVCQGNTRSRCVLSGPAGQLRSGILKGTTPDWNKESTWSDPEWIITKNTRDTKINTTRNINSWRVWLSCGQTRIRLHEWSVGRQTIREPHNGVHKMQCKLYDELLCNRVNLRHVYIELPLLIHLLANIC